VRITYYLLLPICLVLAIFFVSQGMIQNFKPYTKTKLVEPMKISAAKMDSAGKPVLDKDGRPVMEEQTVEEQTIVQGPMASQVAIKMLGTNGGGYTNANAAHPFENPTPLSNFIQMLSIFAIGSGLTYHLGRSVKNQKHGWAVWATMMTLFVGSDILLAGGSKGKPIHQQLGSVGAEKTDSCRGGHIPGHGRNVHDSFASNGIARGRVEFSSCARARADRGTFPDV
jgi:K+-transporting ATPase ATPase A chain